MADFDVTESSDQGALKFLCGDSSRSVTDEHMETFDSMEALLREMNHAPSIEMPEFDASNVSDWLSKVERSFRVRRYSDLDKLDLVAFSLEGDALLWFDSEMTRSQIHSWDEFRHRLFLRFAAPPEASSETVTESLEARASYQVPVSSLEPGLSFSSASLVVSEAWQSDMVSINRVQSQFSLACVKNMNNAHRVFDELSHRRLKCQQRKKLSLSPKSWMFKYKPERRRSRKRHNQDIVRKSQEIFRKDGVTRGVFHTVDQVDIIRPMVEAVGWPLLAAEQVFVNSVKLASESVVEFFIALCGVSAEDLKQFPARVFSLQKLVEISYYNIARIRMVWARIWSVLAEHFVAAGSHHDEKIAMCAIDSLRQLGLQYLESSELSVISTVTSANFGGLQGLLEQVLQGDDEAYTKIFDKLQLILKQGMDLYGASGHGLFLRQQSFSSIWHRWRRKD